MSDRTNPVKFEYLDPGIRLTVRWLIDHNYTTTDSGDGVSKADLIASGHALDFPHVTIRVEPLALLHESQRLLELLIARGLTSDPGTIQATYDPADGVAMIMLAGINDDALVTAKGVQSDAR